MRIDFARQSRALSAGTILGGGDKMNISRISIPTRPLLCFLYLQLQACTTILENPATPRVSMALVGLALLLVLGGCAFYNRPHDVVPPVNGKYDLRIIQADDFGTLWDVAVANKALNDIKASAHQTNTLVVLFIHGWHHNADAEDGNLKDFRQRLDIIYSQLTTEKRRALRERLTGDANINLIGDRKSVV